MTIQSFDDARNQSANIKLGFDSQIQILGGFEKF